MAKGTIYTRAFARAADSLTAGMEKAWYRAGSVPFGEVPVSPETAIRQARGYNLLDAQGQAMRGMTRSISLNGGYGNQNPLGPDSGNRRPRNIRPDLNGQTNKNRAAGIVVDPSSQQVEMAASPDSTLSQPTGTVGTSEY